MYYNKLAQATCVHVYFTRHNIQSRITVNLGRFVAGLTCYPGEVLLETTIEQAGAGSVDMLRLTHFTRKAGVGLGV